MQDGVQAESAPGVAVRDVVGKTAVAREPKWGMKRAHIQAAVLVAVALLSIFVLAPIASNPETLSGVRESLDSQLATVTGFAAGATALSAALSFIVDDGMTPIANQLAELSGWFMVIIAAIVLQKILVTVAGSIAFTIIVPLACALGIAYVYSGREALRSLALRLAAFSLVLFFVIPGSIWVSTALTATHAGITSSASAADSASEDKGAGAVVGDVAADESTDDGGGGLLDSIGDWMSDAADNVGNLVGGALNTLNDIKDNAVAALNTYMEQFALLIVTTCVMPLLVMLLFSWVIKLLFSIDLGVGRLGRTLQAQGSRGVRLVGHGASRLTSKGGS
ncbi:hypothetical protein [Salinibacterium sp. ZJ454]|uniref:hypothetical protein n=1 Tax=Salinibacterium sp. ZJ454 TaxID=2708339 RepID=UPI00142342C2|nr:hypothetical protein [Salinibacterium sp. ZJ454]